MRKRLLVGIPLAVVLIALMVLDGYLAARQPPTWGLPGLPVEIGPWLYNGAICTVIVLALTVLAARELAAFARARGYRPFGRTAQLLVAVLVIGPYISFNLSPYTGGYDESLGLLWMAIALGFLFLSQAVRRGTEKAMETLAITMFIIFYVGGLAGFMTKLRMEVGGSTGVVVLLFSIFLVKMTDTGAYFTGRFFGRHKLIPWLSPKKTWEGFFGGLIVTVGLALGIGLWLRSAGVLAIRDSWLSYPAAMVLLGLGLGLFSVAGDLCASLLKRDAAMKDSGETFPGLGGVLDVLDSALLAAPVAWVFWTRLFHVVGSE